MPAYNPPPQVLFSPVSNFYQGKAIRQQLAAGEQDQEFKALQMGVAREELANAPSAREAAKQKALLDAENIQSQIDERYAKGDRDKLRYSDEVMKPLFQAYGDEENEDRALEIFNIGLPEAISRLPEEDQAAFLEAAGPDRVFDHDEIMRAGLARRYVEDKEKSDYTLDNVRYSGETNEPLTPPRPEAPPNLTDRDKKIRDYQETLNLPEEDSIKLADGLFSVKPNPVDGTVQLIDEVGQVVREIEVDRPPVPIPSPKKGETLLDLIQYATGPINTVAAAISVPLAWANLPTADKVVSARQVFSTTNQDFIRALQNNKRYPMGEREAITEEISMLPKFIDDPKLMRVRALALRGALEVRADQAQRDADDPSNPADFRGGAKQAVSDIRNYLATLGEPTAPEWAVKHLEENPDTIDQFVEHWGYDPREAE
jgi:hypothetical protein